MFEHYEFNTWNVDDMKGLEINFPTKQEDLVGYVIDSFNGRVREIVNAINRVLSGQSDEESAGYNDTYFIIHKDISTAYDDLASLDNETLEEGEEPEIEEVDIPTLRLKEILEDYIAEKEKLGIK